MNWISVKDAPEIPEGDQSVGVICCWYCCSEEPNVVSEVHYHKCGEFKQLAFSSRGVFWIAVNAKYWMPMPKPPVEV